MEKLLIIKCMDNKDLDLYENSEVCNENFLLDKRKIYVRETINYFSEPIKYYYTICPYIRKE